MEITSYHADLARPLDVEVKTRMERMRPPHPAWTAVGTTALAVSGGATEIRAIAKRAAP